MPTDPKNSNTPPVDGDMPSDPDVSSDAYPQPFFGDFFTDTPDHSDSPQPDPLQAAPVAPEPDSGITDAAPDTTAPPSDPDAGDDPETDLIDDPDTAPADQAPDNADPNNPPSPDPEPDTSKFRHKSWADAEKSYANLLGRTTRAEQALAAKVKAEQAQKEKQAQAEIAKESERQRQEFMDTQYEAAMSKIEALDPDDPEYPKVSARIWAEANRASVEFKPDLSAVLPQPDAVLSDPPDAVAPAPDPDAAGDHQPAPIPESEKAVVFKKIDDAITAGGYGFTKEDPAFQLHCSRAPVTDDTGAPVPIDAQINWALKKTSDHYENVKKKLLQQNAQPIPRTGSSGGAPSARDPVPGKNITLSDAIDAARNRRQLK